MTRVHQADVEWVAMRLASPIGWAGPGDTPRCRRPQRLRDAVRAWRLE
jgi:hypothetical protein